MKKYIREFINYDKYYNIREYFSKEFEIKIIHNNNVIENQNYPTITLEQCIFSGGFLEDFATSHDFLSEDKCEMYIPLILDDELRTKLSYELIEKLVVFIKFKFQTEKKVKKIYNSLSNFSYNIEEIMEIYDIDFIQNLAYEKELNIRLPNSTHFFIKREYPLKNDFFVMLVLSNFLRIDILLDIFDKMIFLIKFTMKPSKFFKLFGVTNIKTCGEYFSDYIYI